MLLTVANDFLKVAQMASTAKTTTLTKRCPHLRAPATESRWARSRCIELLAR